MKTMLIAMAFMALLLYGCTGYSQPQQSQQAAGVQQGGQPPAANDANAAPAAQQAGATKEFTIKASQFQFSPSAITVSRGDTVRITLVSADKGHGMAIPEFGFNLQVGAGATASGQFVASKPGTYTFICSVPCGPGHKEMTGTLIVT